VSRATNATPSTLGVRAERARSVTFQRRVSGVRTAARTGVRIAVLALATLMVVYLPLEPAILSLLPAAAYWPVRLAPDAATALLLAVTLVVDIQRSDRAHRLLAIVTIATAALVLINVARGFSPVDAVNALRVVVRYPLLALLVYKNASRSYVRILELAIVVSISLEVAAAVTELVIQSVHAGIPHLPIAGTTGRYDRFGLFALASMLFVVAYRGAMSRWVLVAAVTVLGLLIVGSTSRQAMVALLVGLISLLIVTRVVPGRFTVADRGPGHAGVAQRMGPLRGARRLLARRGVSLALGAAAVGLAAAVLTSTVTSVRYREPGSGMLESGDRPTPMTAQRADDAGQTTTASMPARAAFQWSVDPNRNFRLFYNLVVIPSAMSVEPLIGFGPGTPTAQDTDPRLAAIVESHGTSWEWARQFMSDSNYGSMLLQFGIPTTLMFVVSVVAVVFLTASKWLTARSRLALFVSAFGVAVLAAAFFGPGFEIRPVSGLFWLSAAAAFVPMHAGGDSRAADPSR
jgi:hypothetical protein